MILFVGNLSKLTSERELKELFAGYGTISRLRIMFDKITRRSRGYAYVDLEQDSQAFDAMDKLNSSMFMDSYIIVGIATQGQLSSIDWQ